MVGARIKKAFVNRSTAADDFVTGQVFKFQYRIDNSLDKAAAHSMQSVEGILQEAKKDF